MSVHTHPANNSPIFNAWQLLCSQLIPVVNYGPSDVTGFASGAAKASTQQKPMGFFKRLGQRMERKEMARQEAYLAESTDIYDLEHRMKQMEYLSDSNASQRNN